MSVLVGKTAPDFTAKAVLGNKIMDQWTLSDYKGRYIVLFFYPFDFSFVCPTELHAFSDSQPEFEKRGVELVAVSVDSEFSHFAWLNMPKTKGGIEGVGYPIISDIHKTISHDYDVLAEDEGAAYRGLFLIDREFVVRYQVVNDMALGRSVGETLRMVDALQYTEKYGEVCPANWNRGDRALQGTREGIETYFK